MFIESGYPFPAEATLPFIYLEGLTSLGLGDSSTVKNTCILQKMETSLRYAGDSKSLVIHAKEKFPLNTFTHLQGHAELDTKIGAPTYLCAMIRQYFPDQYASLGVGVQYYRRQKLWYTVRGKKEFPVTANNSVNFHIKGKYDVDEKLLERKSRVAAEFTWDIMDVKKDQDVRLKVGYEVIEKVPYFQFSENNWTLTVNNIGKWKVKYGL